MTYKELIALLRKPGKVMLPVMMPDDVVHLECVKSDVLAWAKQHGENEECGWRITYQSAHSVTLDTDN
jgi:hypothetical protein